jgi:hypothetical protein
MASTRDVRRAVDILEALRLAVSPTEAEEAEE